MQFFYVLTYPGGCFCAKKEEKASISFRRIKRKANTGKTPLSSFLFSISSPDHCRCQPPFFSPSVVDKISITSRSIKKNGREKNASTLPFKRRILERKKATVYTFIVIFFCDLEMRENVEFLIESPSVALLFWESKSKVVVH